MNFQQFSDQSHLVMGTNTLKQAFDRDQFMMTTWDSVVDPESTARELIEVRLGIGFCDDT